MDNRRGPLAVQDINGHVKRNQYGAKLLADSEN